MGNNQRSMLGIMPNKDHLKLSLILGNIQEIFTVNLHKFALTKDRISYEMGGNS